MKLKNYIGLLVLLFLFKTGFSIQILVPMDDKQKQHLKAYGIAFWILKKDKGVEWLLNYRGGSFLFDYDVEVEKECILRGVIYEQKTGAEVNGIKATIANPDINMEIVKLLKAPKIAVYSPKSKQPWDDAVTLVLTYAEIPYEIVFDEEVMDGKLPLYDWLHLHHEDFTGQMGKFISYSGQQWYKDQVAEGEKMAAKYNLAKIPDLKLAVAKKIREFTSGGGFLFAMCSATDTYDIALAADGIDIVHQAYDGDGQDPDAQKKLNYDNCFAFKDFTLVTNPYIYEHSNIDVDNRKRPMLVQENEDFFTLFDYSAKWDIIPTILCQNHTKIIKGFYGQNTAYRKPLVKSNVLIMGENRSLNEARYLHGTFGKGTWTFYSGHDPEDYQHHVGEPPTELSLHPSSPGYRLILNNILFPSAKKKKQKT
jgi:hypothetical protein